MFTSRIIKKIKPFNLLQILKRLVRRKKVSDSVDPRRFWKGEIIKSPVVNVPFFSENSESAVTLTYEKESRDCIFIEAGNIFDLDLSITEKKFKLKLSFAFEGSPSMNESIKVFQGEEVVAELKYITSKRWHTVNIDIKSSGNSQFKIQNSCNTRVYFSHPIIENIYIESKENKQPKNVIIILLDSLWRDSIGPYDVELEKYTPNITRFFSDSIKYLNAFSQSEWTYPSIYSFLTSRYPLDHGMCDLHVPSSGMLSYDGENLAEKFKKMEYSTFAYSTVKVFHPGFNSHIGFDRFFYDPFPQPVQTHLGICRKAIEQLSNNKNGKNFLFLHFLDTHEPWSNSDDFEDGILSNFRITDPTKEYDHLKKGHGDTKAEPVFNDQGMQILTQRRNARLFNVDLSLQTLFDYLERSGEIDKTVVALCSDHGYQYLSEKRPLFCNTRVNVPLLIKHPDFKQQTVEDLVAVSLDLGPTLMKFCGEKYEKSEGGVVFPFGQETRDYVLSESIFGNLYKAAIRDKEYVYHFSCLYNKEKNKIILEDVKNVRLIKCTNEILNVDLYEEMPEIIKKMHKILKKHLVRYSDTVV